MTTPSEGSSVFLRRRAFDVTFSAARFAPDVPRPTASLIELVTPPRLAPVSLRVGSAATGSSTTSWSERRPPLPRLVSFEK
ncbi:MAG: hypothetical protein R2697_15705 [Ilumatobacteraceae bacterium]